jgi:hypothetical protein
VGDMCLRRFLPLWFGLISLAAVGNVAAPQEQRGEAGAAAGPQEPPADPDIVVTGRRIGELRFELRIAEEAVYARFNDINSDDRFDIHCETEKRYASRMTERRCLSSSWRELDAEIGEAVSRAMRGIPGPSPQSFQAEQLRMQQLLQEEMIKLSLQDDGLNRVVMELGDKQLQLNEARGRDLALTRERELRAVDGRLPFGAQRAFEVKIEGDSWSQALTQRTFTIALLSGEIRELEITCDGGSEDLNFAPDVEWTLPVDWSACILRVRAQRDTTFALYEF